MVFSSNFQKIVICAFSLFLTITFNACGDSLQDKILISTDPETPEVRLIDLPADDDEEDGFDGATAPYFQLDYVIDNGSDSTFILTNLILTVSPQGSTTESSEVNLDASQLDEDLENSFYSLALAVVEPNKQWQSSVNGGVLWYIDSLPEVTNNAGINSTRYEVNMRAVGFFVEISDSSASTLDPDDETTTFDRTFRIFTE